MDPFSPFHPLNWRTSVKQEQAPGTKHELSAYEVLASVVVVLAIMWHMIRRSQ